MNNKSRATQIGETVLPAMSVVIFLLAWEALVHWRGIAPIFLPAPSSIFVYLWRMIADGSMEYHLGVTLLRIFAGFFIAAVSGVALGLLMGMFESLPELPICGSPHSIRCRRFRSSRCSSSGLGPASPIGL